MKIFLMLLGFLRKQIGLRTDVASATGTLHAKVADVKAQIDVLPSTRQAPRGVVTASRGSFSTASATLTTALDISGKGKLMKLGFFVNNGQSGTIQITVDGILVLSHISNSNAGQLYPVHTVYLSSAATGLMALETAGGDANYAEIEFNTSLKIAIASQGTTFHRVDWFYVRE